MSVDEELKKLRAENHDLKEQIQNYIPRRRVRRVYKQLKKIRSKYQFLYILFIKKLKLFFC